MQKIWFIDIDGKLTGPFSLLQLRGFPNLTPDTLVWREGYKKSIPIRYVPELQELFEDAEPLNPEPDDDSVIKIRPKGNATDELAIDMGATPPSWLFAILMALIFILLFLHFMNGL